MRSINISSQQCHSYIIRTSSGNFECASVDDIRKLDASNNYTVLAYIPWVPIEGSFGKLGDLLDGIKKEVGEDPFLEGLIISLEKESLKVNYKRSDGKEVYVFLPNVVNRAYNRILNLYEQAGVSPIDIAKIDFALAEAVLQENVGEAFARIVDEGKVTIKDLDNNMKNQMFRLNDYPFRLVDSEAGSMKLKQFKLDEFLKHLSILFSILEKKYRSREDTSPIIKDAHTTLHELIPELF